MALRGLAHILFEQGRLDRGRGDGCRALRVRSACRGRHHTLLGAIRLEAGPARRSSGSTGAAAIRLEPNNPETHSDLGATCSSGSARRGTGPLHRGPAARTEMARLRISNLAHIPCSQQGRARGGRRAHLVEAVRLEPRCAAQAGPEGVLVPSRNLERAVTSHFEAMRLNPDDASARAPPSNRALLELDRFEGCQGPLFAGARLATTRSRCAWIWEISCGGSAGSRRRTGPVFRGSSASIPSDVDAEIPMPSSRTYPRGGVSRRPPMRSRRRPAC